MRTAMSWNGRCNLLPGLSKGEDPATHPRGSSSSDNGPLSGLPPTLGRSNALDDKGRPESADLCASSSHDGMIVSCP